MSAPTNAICEKSTKHKVTGVPEDSVSYLALTLRAWLQDLVFSMILAAHHYTDTRHDRPTGLRRRDINVGSRCAEQRGKAARGP